VSTAQDLPGLYGEPLAAPVPALRLVPAQPLDFDDAVRRVRPRLHRYAIRRLGDSHEAEELVQEALLRAYTHREQLLTEEDLSAWTTVVTGRLVIDRLRVRGRSTSVADVPEGSRVGRDTAEVVVARDEARTALDALDAMPSRQASLLWAREVEGKSYDELCAHFGMTEPAVRSVLTRARKALRREYELRGGTVPVGGLAVLAPWIAGLSWADKLRRAANRVTAPAVLGAAGIAALGGLVLSPFGSGQGGTTTFSPSQAVVASTVHSTPATRDLLGPALTTPSLQAQGGGAATLSTRRPHDVGANPLAPLNSIPCTNADDGHVLGRLSLSVAFGGSSCWHGSDVGVGPDLPEKVVDTTGYDHLTVSTDVVHCSDIRPLATQTQLIQCSETQK
jgi:RNA polymerase sigma factor (sigma-70 family)